MKTEIIDICFEELKASNQLPSPSGVALDIIRLTQDPNHKLEDLLRPIHSDPVLAGRLLKMANSANNAFMPPAISLQDALMRVGTKALAHLALSLSVLDNNRLGACAGFDYDRFWITSLLRALAMQLLCNATTPLRAEEAFSVGLLAEIGRLALAQIHPVHYAECLQNLDKSLLELENETFLINHQQISLQMMGEWGIPDWILKAVKLSFSNQILLEEEEDKRLGFLANQLRLASFLAGTHSLDQGSRNLPALLEQLSLSYLAVDQIRGRLFLEWRSWGELLFLPINDYRDVLINPDSLATNEQATDSLKILVVDDDRTERHILSSYLTNRGYTVLTAEDGDQALKQYIVYRPDVVITDYMMQPIDGLALTRTLRSNQETQSVYVILITADRDMDIMTAAFDAGVNDFITKPVHRDELNARIIGATQFLRRYNNQASERNEIRKEAVELALAKRRFAALAITDPLTGLHNRRYANFRLEQEWSLFLRHNRAFGIVSLDLDLFKQINDNYGHDCGDRVLQHFAHLLQESIRSEDIVCRMGGEEFIVITPNIDHATIGALCERIRNRVETQQPLELKLSRLITVSVGAAIADLTVDNEPGDLIKRSDEALYQAKAAGRNRTVVDSF